MQCCIMLHEHSSARKGYFWVSIKSCSMMRVFRSLFFKRLRLTRFEACHITYYVVSTFALLDHQLLLMLRFMIVLLLLNITLVQQLSFQAVYYGQGTGSCN